jgi:RNA polymerase sigma-70 factor (ECF subfamily)
MLAYAPAREQIEIAHGKKTVAQAGVLKQAGEEIPRRQFVAIFSNSPLKIRPQCLNGYPAHIDKSVLQDCLVCEQGGTPMDENEDIQSKIKARLAAGDLSALDLIWQEYAADLLGYLVTIHRSRHEAEDTLQEVFMTIATKRDYVAAARNFRAYLFRLARNAALNRIKREGRQRERLNRAADWLEIEESEAGGEDRSGLLAAALARLPEKQRTVVVLKFFRDKTLSEIGDMLRISGNTAASRLRYGMRRLNTLLAEETP